MAGKLVSEAKVKCSKGDVFHFFKFPNQFAECCPDVIQSVDLLAGHWGNPGSLVFWNFTIDGRKMGAKEMIEAVDEKKKSITYKVIEGDLMEYFNTFRITVAVDCEGEDNLITWTFEYEKKSETVPDPRTLMDIAIASTKQIQSHHLLVPN